MTTIRFLKAIKSDIILQNKYEGGWFTAASVLNAFDLSGDNNFSRVCSPLADVAGEIIYSSISEGDIATAINEMTNAEIFDNDEIDGDTLYSLSLEYRYILSIFTNMRNRIAICKYDESGKTDIVYAISNETETWAFSIQNDEGKIERPDEIRFKQVLDEIFIVEDTDVSVQKQIPQKFCTNCGFRLSTESKYCSNCGVSVL